jgi:hypothetical protein
MWKRGKSVDLCAVAFLARQSFLAEKLMVVRETVERAARQPDEARCMAVEPVTSSQVKPTGSEGFGRGQNGNQTGDPAREGRWIRAQAGRPQTGRRPRQNRANRCYPETPSQNTAAGRPVKALGRDGPRARMKPRQAVRAHQCVPAPNGEQRHQHRGRNNGRRAGQSEHELQSTEKNPGDNRDQKEEFKHGLIIGPPRGASKPPAPHEPQDQRTTSLGAPPCMASQRARNSATSTVASAGSLRPKICAL